MASYSEEQKSEDFAFFKSINKDFFSKNGHKFLAINNKAVVDSADSVQELITKMNRKDFAIGTYLIQECTGDDSAFTNVVMRLIVNG